MIEIKFRIRGRKPGQKGIETYYHTLEELINYSIPRGFIVETIDQFTGMKYDDGKDMYDRDIVKAIEEIYRCRECKDKIYYHTLKIQWHEGGFSWWARTKHDTVYELYRLKKPVFIGTMHDNPELFEEESA